MKNLLILIFLSLFFTNCKHENNKTKLPVQEMSTNEQITVYETYAELAPLFQNHNDTTYVVNFWATTCAPCLQEMPHFEELEKKYRDEKVRVVLVSLDLKRHLQSRVLPFIKKHKIEPEVVLLVDQNYSAWTAKVDPSWYGALPATLIFKNGDKKFSFGAFQSFDDLKKEMKPFIVKE